MYLYGGVYRWKTCLKSAYVGMYNGSMDMRLEQQ